jgi:carboxymethylenebutenolidase
MCFDLDSHPPITPIAGGALDGMPLMLTAADRNRFAAFRVRAADPSGAAVVILPDVRGLHPYYEELALRFAENGSTRWPSTGSGGPAVRTRATKGFDYSPHVIQDDVGRISADITAAGRGVSVPTATTAPRAVFTLGFCMGGRMSFLAGDLGSRPGWRDGHVRARSSGRGATTRRRRSTLQRGSPAGPAACSAGAESVITGPRRSRRSTAGSRPQ